MTVVNLGNGVMDVIARGADARLARARVAALEEDVKIKKGRNKMELARIFLDAQRVAIERSKADSTISLRQTEIDMAEMLLAAGFPEAQVDLLRARGRLTQAQTTDIPVRSELVARGLENEETRTGIEQQRADDTRDAREDQVGLGESQLGETARQFNLGQDLNERQFELTKSQLATAGALTLIQSGVPSIVDDIKNTPPTLEESRVRVETYIPELERMNAPTTPADMEIWAQADFAAVSALFVENRRLDRDFSDMAQHRRLQNLARGTSAAPPAENEEARGLRDRKNSLAEALDVAELFRTTLAGPDVPQEQKDSADANIARINREQSRNAIDLAKLLRRQETRREEFKGIRGPSVGIIGAPGAISDLGRIVGRQNFNGQSYDMVRAANGGVFPLVNSKAQRDNLSPETNYIMITRDGKVIQRTTPKRR